MSQLTEQTQDLAFTNYKTFVETAETSRTIMKDLGKSKDALATFLDTTPDFIQECEKFSQLTGNIVKGKRFCNLLINPKPPAVSAAVRGLGPALHWGPHVLHSLLSFLSRKCG